MTSNLQFISLKLVYLNVNPDNKLIELKLKAHLYIQVLMDKKFKMGLSNINEAFPALLRFIGLVLSCLVLTVVSTSIRAITTLGYFLVSIIESSTGASPKKYMPFHTQRHENTNLLYNGNANSSVIDERLTLFNSLSQVK